MIEIDISNGVNITHKDHYPIGAVVVHNNNELSMIVMVATNVCKLINLNSDMGNRYIDREMTSYRCEDYYCGCVRAEDVRKIVSLEKVLN